MFEDFLNHTCNIYHLSDETVNVSYGVKAASVKKPQQKPAEIGVKCHFHIRTNSGIRVSQKEPYSVLAGEGKLTLPPGTDIRLNDMVEDCRNGVKYRAGLPKEIHGGHHIIVDISRTDGAEAAL